MNGNRIAWLLVALTGMLTAGRGSAEDRPVRLADGVTGHIHPAVCLTKKGTVLVIFSKSDMKDLRISRSSDGGRTWSEHAPFPHTVNVSLYPGSLTTLADGRIVHAWNVWYTEDGKKSRYVDFSISEDDGKTWGEPKSLAKNPNAESIIRHPILELAPDRWLFSLSDRTIVYDPTTGKETPFGDGRKHSLVPIVRTAKGTFVSGAGLRSIDGGKTWEKIAPFPNLASQGWRHEMVALDNGLLIASVIPGPGTGGTSLQHVVSRDDGKTWDMEKPVEWYNPGRPIGGRACPRTVQIDRETLGTIFYDVDATQPGGAGVFFLRQPMKRYE